MEFTVRLSAPSAGGVSVKVSTRDSTPGLGDGAEGLLAALRTDGELPRGRDRTVRRGSSSSTTATTRSPRRSRWCCRMPGARRSATGSRWGQLPTTTRCRRRGWRGSGARLRSRLWTGIAGRMAADRTAGMQGSIAGQSALLRSGRQRQPRIAGEPAPAMRRTAPRFGRDRRAGAGRCRAGVGAASPARSASAMTRPASAGRPRRNRGP